MRSLRHYDKLGLIKPKTCSTSGYRLYSHEDIQRLHQIVTLKQMKIPLLKIKSMLIEDSMSLRNTLELQQKFLQQKLAQYQKICGNVERLLAHITNQTPISLELIYTTMENIKVLEKYYTPEQLDALKQREFNLSQEKAIEYDQAWREIFDGLAHLQSQGVDASDPQTKVFAVKSRELLQLFTAGDKSIEESINTMYQQEGGGQMLRNHGLDVSDELYAYYEAALHAHVK